MHPDVMPPRLSVDGVVRRIQDGPRVMRLHGKIPMELMADQDRADRNSRCLDRFRGETWFELLSGEPVVDVAEVQAEIRVAQKYRILRSRVHGLRRWGRRILR